MTAQKLFLIDGASYLFRSFYAIRNMQTPEGFPTNALYGFIRSVEKIIADFNPDYIAVVFDGPNNKKSRQALYEDYKANRTGMPEELAMQIPKALLFCDLYGLPVIQEDGVEADDVIGSISKWAPSVELEVAICSSDKDLCQLINDSTKMIHTHKNNTVVDRNKVKKIYGVYPHQIVDYLALVGDTSDNIPGVKGIGPKAAAELLSEFETLENVYKEISLIKSQRRQQLLLDNQSHAFLSKSLATLHDIQIPTETKWYEITTANREDLFAFYREMHFNTLAAQLKEAKPQVQKQQREYDYKIIHTENDLEYMLSTLKQHKHITVDTEATSLKKMEARLVGIGFAVDQHAFYLPLNGTLDKQVALKAAKDLLEDSSYAFNGHHIKYDLHILKNAGIDIKCIGFDTMLASHLLNPNQSRHGLDALTMEHFGYEKVTLKSLTKSGKETIGIDAIDVDTLGDYCCEDVEFTHRLKALLSPKIDENDLSTTLYDIDLPLIKVLMRMEREGIFVNQDVLKDIELALKEKLLATDEAIFHECDEVFNINSPKQLSAVLFEKMGIPPIGKKKATGYSTSADVLEALQASHPIITKVITHRLLDKMRSTYVEALPKQITETTGRIHCTFNQTVTATGRLSCQDPNLQNIPVRSDIGKMIRTSFMPSQADVSFLSADYSQIELRILAHLSKDDRLLHAFNNNLDVHTSTASQVYQVPMDQVTKEMRYNAKAVNFGLIYGQGAYGLSKQLQISVKEASQFIDSYFKTYPGVKEFLDETKAKAKESETSLSITKRKRPLPDINSKNAMLRAQAERFAVNTPIQGAQADIIKMAMIQLDEKIRQKQLKTRMLLQIHDELIFEAPDDELEIVKEIVCQTMESAFLLNVPLKVDISVGKNWGEC